MQGIIDAVGHSSNVKLGTIRGGKPCLHYFEHRHTSLKPMDVQYYTGTSYALLMISAADKCNPSFVSRKEDEMSLTLFGYPIHHRC